MANALDIISRSLRTINAIATGEVPSAAEGQDAFIALNGMIDSFQAQRLMIFNVQRVVLGDLTIGQQAYSLGPGGYFDMARPAKIERYGIISLNNPAQPLELPLNTDGQNMTLDGWASIPTKNVQSALPLYVWDDGGFPLRTLNYWCIPSANVQATIYPWIALNSFPDLVTDIEFPPAYYELLVYNLALRLSAEFGGNIPQIVSSMAVQSVARVKSSNVPLLEMGMDPSLTSRSGYYNWISDTFGPGPR